MRKLPSFIRFNPEWGVIMKRIYSVTKLITLIIGTTMLLGSICLATGNKSIVETATGESDISVYMKGVDSVSDDVSVQVGTAAGEIINCERVEALEMQTLILLDNSLSMPSAVRPKIAELMQDLIGDRAAKETISIAVFDEKITYLTDYTSDYATLKNVVEQITYKDQETYLTDVLYELLATNYGTNRKEAFQRIIILSDGVDNKSLGYTKEELYALMKENPYPIYTIGCKTKNNNEQLESMFALSRLSNAEYFLLDESDTLTIIDKLKEDRNIVRIKIGLPAEIMDGSKKAVKLSFQGVDVSCEMKMPQIEVKKEEPVETETIIVEETMVEEETESIEDVTQEDEELEEETEIEMEEEDETSIYQIIFIVIIGCIILIVITICILCIIMINRKKKQQQEQTKQFMYEKENALNNVLASSVSQEKDTGMVENSVKTSVTDIAMMGNQNTIRYLVLTDVRVPAKSFQIPFKENIIIGRKKEVCHLVLDYDMSISSKHCEIRMYNNRFYIRDLQSLNGTCVNGKRILVETEIVSGCFITLGRLEMRFEIR